MLQAGGDHDEAIPAVRVSCPVFYWLGSGITLTLNHMEVYIYRSGVDTPGGLHIGFYEGHGYRSIY